MPPFAADPDGAAPAQITVSFHPGGPPARPLLRRQHNVHYASSGFRFVAGEQATFDAYDGCRVEVYGGPAWTGSFPMALYTTVTALLLAGRGCLPMHGSTVLEGGVATLICGPAGAGKSTTAARMLVRGAQLISDDLSVVHPAAAGGPPILFAGRQSIRLFPATAARLGQSLGWLAPPQASLHKVAVFPPRVEPGRACPLARILILGYPAGPVAHNLRASVLAQHFFRRMCVKEIPGQKVRLAMLAIAVRDLEVVGEPAL